jgi:integrase
MIAHLVKRGRLYSGRIRLSEEARTILVPLGCSNRQVAEKRLQEAVAEREREAAGIIAPKVEREAANKPLKAHLEDWIATKEKVRDDQYLKCCRNQICRLLKECNWTFAKDVNADDLSRWMGESSLSAKSLNHYLTTARTLLNWMVKQGRITFNPLRSVDLLPGNEEKRRPRRALSDDDFSKLVDGSGERGIAYLVAATTGSRFGEMLEVERGDIHLDDGDPRIVARAATTKNRKEASLPLHAAVAEQLRTFLADLECGPADKVFAPLFRKRHQFKRDLEAVGIPRTDAQGRVVDFHSLRYTFCTNLQRLGTPQRVLMHLMRHSDRRLSDHIYTDTELLPASETVQKLVVPQKRAAGLSQIVSQNLVPAGHAVSHRGTAANGADRPQTRMDACFQHDEARAVTSCHEGGKMRGTGFEPASEQAGMRVCA